MFLNVTQIVGTMIAALLQKSNNTEVLEITYGKYIPA